MQRRVWVNWTGADLNHFIIASQAWSQRYGCIMPEYSTKPTNTQGHVRDTHTPCHLATPGRNRGISTPSASTVKAKLQNARANELQFREQCVWWITFFETDFSIRMTRLERWITLGVSLFITSTGNPRNCLGGEAWSYLIYEASTKTTAVSHCSWMPVTPQLVRW